MQWIEFANCEILRCNKSIIYPIFGWSDLNKEEFDRDNKKIKENLMLIEKELEKNEFIAGNKMTLADIKLFASLRFLMMFHFPEQMRNKLFPKINQWFEKIMNSAEAMKAYGRTILCKNILKPFSGVINRNKGNEDDKPEEGNKKESKGKKQKQDKNHEENKKEVK